MTNFRGYLRISALSLIVLSLSLSRPSPVVSAEQNSGRVEIVIRNSRYEFQGGNLKKDAAATIVVHNLDNIEHGFSSALFEELDLEVDSKGAVVYGKGITGTHISPGETVQFHFLPIRSGRFPFHCDLHPSMKGEFFILSVVEA